MYTKHDLIDLSEGNFGALRVCRDLFEDFDREPIDILRRNGIRGSDIWLLFKDICLEDLMATIKTLRNGTAVEQLKQNKFSSFYNQKR